ncbi:uncharacterized protein LOC135001191 [Pseudophryne corroboree]|uniref:uncharacterized protein LOC135001191 n=1 Tax=Pseudophryne corroboree TaxID=495146 RepID=UPI003081E28E
MRGQRRRRRGNGRALSSRMVVNSRNPVNTQNSDRSSFGCVTQPCSQRERRGERYKWRVRNMKKNHGQISVYGWDNEKVVRQNGRLQRPHQTKQEAKAEPKPPAVLNTHGKIRQRNFRFSIAENMVLISKLVPVYEQLLGRRKPRMPLLWRTQMWEEICDAVNRVGKRQRFVNHCKKRFNDIKRQLRTKLNLEKRTVRNKDGLFTRDVYYTKYEEELKKVLPAEVIDGIEFYDSNQPLEPLLDDGPLCSQHDEQELPLTRNPSSDSKLQYNSESGPVHAPLHLGDLLEEQWHMLPDRCPTYTVESRTLLPGPTAPHHGLLRRSKFTRGQRSPHPSPATPTPSAQPPSKQLKILKATQWLYRKGIIHNLNVLHLDINQLTDSIAKNNLIAKNMLKAENQRNRILHQMNNKIGAVAESIQLLVNQQQAERILWSDGPRRPGKKERASSLRGSSVTTATFATAPQSRDVRITSSSLVCISDAGFLPTTDDTEVY